MGSELALVADAAVPAAAPGRALREREPGRGKPRQRARRGVFPLWACGRGADASGDRRHRSAISGDRRGPRRQGRRSRGMRRLRPLARKLRRWTGRNRPAILLYHRVARIAHDPWALAVPPDLFAEQMEALSRTRRVVPLTRLAEELERGRARANWIAITFDDGYADLLHEAVPAMQSFDCPATMFVTTGALGGDGFWWDRLSEAVFRPERVATALALGAGG